MDKNELERLTKAEHSAGFLLDDLREIVKFTDNVALEEIVVEAIGQVTTLHRRLKRIAEKQG